METVLTLLGLYTLGASLMYGYTYNQYAAATNNFTADRFRNQYVTETDAIGTAMLKGAGWPIVLLGVFGIRVTKPYVPVPEKKEDGSNRAGY